MNRTDLSKRAKDGLQGEQAVSQEEGVVASRDEKHRNGIASGQKLPVLNTNARPSRRLVVSFSVFCLCFFFLRFYLF